MKTFYKLLSLLIKIYHEIIMFLLTNCSMSVCFPGLRIWGVGGHSELLMELRSIKSDLSTAPARNGGEHPVEAGLTM
jgi:hypothetical protein